MAFMNALLAIADPGDEVILPTPYYFNHEMAITIANCKAVLVPVDDHHQLRPAALRAAITPRTRAIVTISPNNPTGAVYPESALREVNAICRDAGIYHICDEAYEYFTWDSAKHFSRRLHPRQRVSHDQPLLPLQVPRLRRLANRLDGHPRAPPRRRAQDPGHHPDLSARRLPARRHRRARGRPRLVRHPHPGDRRRPRDGLNELEPLAGIATIPRADGAFYFLIDVHTKLPP